MSRMGIVSFMLDTSFCIRLMDANDNLHAHALEYFRFFLQEKITIHLSTIVAAEYAVGDDPENLPLNNLQLKPSISAMPKVPAYFTGSLWEIKPTSRDIIEESLPTT